MTGRVFVVKIRLGNDAMQTPEDISRALTNVRILLDDHHLRGTIRDTNGNSVGDFGVYS